MAVGRVSVRVGGVARWVVAGRVLGSGAAGVFVRVRRAARERGRLARGDDRCAL